MKRGFKNKILFRASVCLAAAGVLMACTNDNDSPGGSADPLEIRLSGISEGVSTRVGTSGEAAVNLVAYNGDDMGKRYFEPTRIISAAPLGLSPSGLTLETPRYYPLGDNELRFFAYTGSINSKYEMNLTAGNTPSRDYVLSNFGKRSTDSGINDAYEGEGTPGSATEPAEILQFRHVMTQLTVQVEVDESQSNPVDPKPKKVEFEIDGIYAKGYYSIMAATPDPLTSPVDTARNNGTDLYKARLGVNYLVPTGLDMVGRHFTSLVIDDYVATDDDLAEFKIEGSKSEPKMQLYPGYAYRITLKIQKLQLMGVVIEQVDWDTEPVYGYDPTYDPNVLSLDITGGYQNSGEDIITRVVLHSDETRQYVGQAGENDGEIEFVTLPADGRVVSADLYTSKGLLVTIPVGASDYVSNTLSVTLSKVGMLPADPGDPVNSAANPYLITTLAQFFNIEKDLTAFYRQETDLEVDGLEATNTFFTGFGTFEGHYDGNGYWIGALDISCPGLFTENRGTLLNVRLYTGNLDLSGNTYAGSLCAVNSGLIYACVNETSLFGATGTVGGICGLNLPGGRVVASVNTGNIRAGATVGGICGENRSTAPDTFMACLSIGNASPGSTTTGSIIGRSSDAPSTAVINTSFWLSGAMEASIGESEGPVGTGDVGVNDTAGLDPDKMRNGIDEGETNDDRILNKLNAVLPTDADYYPEYSYVLSPLLTGITWPMPYKL